MRTKTKNNIMPKIEPAIQEELTQLLINSVPTGPTEWPSQELRDTLEEAGLITQPQRYLWETVLESSSYSPEGGA